LIPGDFQYTRPSGKKLALFSVLGVGGLVGFIVTVLVITFVITAWIGQPVIFGNDQGPTQPIAFPHPTHVQILGLDCTFCHRGVTTGPAATIPAVGLCMTCHLAVGDDDAGNALPEIAKLREAFDESEPIDWVRVHRMPDHVHFVHEAHIKFFSERDRIAPSAVCSTCHGDVGAMQVVKQVEPLKMSQCVDCHRDNGAPTDCVICHY